MTVITNDRPAYRVLAVQGFFGPDDTLYPKDSEIYFDGEPNQEFEPLNEIAKERMFQLFEKLDKEALRVSEKTGKAFAGRPKSVDGGYEMARAIELSKVAVMGHLNKDVDTSIQPIEEKDVPETSRRGRGRPRKTLEV